MINAKFLQLILEEDSDAVIIHGDIIKTSISSSLIRTIYLRAVDHILILETCHGT